MNAKGFTVLELLIATAISVVVVAASLSFFGGTEKVARANLQLTDIQQDARAAMEMLVRDIRMAGFGTSESGACANAINPVNQSAGPDRISMAGMYNKTTQLAKETSSRNQIALATDVAGVISLNGIFTTSIEGKIPDGLFKISPPLSEGEFYPSGTPVFTPDCISYSVVNNAQGHPELRRGSANIPLDSPDSLLAEGVLDMQFAYAEDKNGDGLIDDANGSATFDSADFVNQPSHPSAIRLVRVTLLLKTKKADPNYYGGTPFAIEDHNPATDAGFDKTTYSQFRKRLLTRTVRPRNMGLS